MYRSTSMPTVCQKSCWCLAMRSTRTALLPRFPNWPGNIQTRTFSFLSFRKRFKRTPRTPGHSFKECCKLGTTHHPNQRISVQRTSSRSSTTLVGRGRHRMPCRKSHLTTIAIRGEVELLDSREGSMLAMQKNGLHGITRRFKHLAPASLAYVMPRRASATKMSGKSPSMPSLWAS